MQARTKRQRHNCPETTKGREREKMRKQNENINGKNPQQNREKQRIRKERIKEIKLHRQHLHFPLFSHFFPVDFFFLVALFSVSWS